MIEQQPALDPKAQAVILRSEQTLLRGSSVGECSARPGDNPNTRIALEPLYEPVTGLIGLRAIRTRATYHSVTVYETR